MSLHRFRSYTKFLRVTLFVGVVFCLVSTQALVLAHDISHVNHEQSEVCAALNGFSAGKDALVLAGALYIDSSETIAPSAWVSPWVDVSALSHYRGRAPPTL